MALSRRDFFGQFWNSRKRSDEERQRRMGVLLTYARTTLLPYDFSLTPEQNAELVAEVQRALEAATEDDLFAPAIWKIVEATVEGKIVPWRQQYWFDDQTRRVQETKVAARDHVVAFLKTEAGPTELESLQKRFGIEDPTALEAHLQTQIENSLDSLTYEEILGYDNTAIRELILTELRSWC